VCMCTGHVPRLCMGLRSRSVYVHRSRTEVVYGAPQHVRAGVALQRLPPQLPHARVSMPQLPPRARARVGPRARASVMA
jgi:hypothetical protein